MKQNAAEAKRWRQHAAEKLGKDGDELVRRLVFLANPIGQAALPAKGTLKGKAFKLEDYRGKIVVLKFSADWCPACRALVPEQKRLEQSLQKYPFVLLDVDTDANPNLANDWDVRFVPTVYVIDAAGVVQHVGWNDGLEKRVVSLVASLIDKSKKK